MYRPKHKIAWKPKRHLLFYNWPVVRKPISVNPRLNRPNPRSKFILRLNCVPRSLISTIQRLNEGLNLTHLAGWINSLIGKSRWKSSQTNQSGGLTLSWFCFNPEFGEERKAIFRLPDDFSEFNFYYSLTDEPFRVRFFHAFSSFRITGRPLFVDPQNVLHDDGEARNFNIATQVEIVAY